MPYMLDTNVCILYLNGRSERIQEKIESLSFQEVSLCSVVKAELIYGALKSGNPEKNLEKLGFFTMHFSSFPFDDSAAEIYGGIRRQLEKEGTPIGPNDLMIGAIALANQMTLVTHNIKEFCRIKELSVEDWEA